MTSRTFLVEVNDSGDIITGELRRVTWTIRTDTAEPGVRRISLEAVILSATVEQNPGTAEPDFLPGSFLEG